MDDCGAQQANIGVDQISGVEVFGGSTRIPSLLAAIRDRYPTLTVARHVDGDESLVFGAAHYSGMITSPQYHHFHSLPIRFFTLVSMAFMYAGHIPQLY
jgi:molecular chaperone DnaK (HSP70)